MTTLASFAAKLLPLAASFSLALCAPGCDQAKKPKPTPAPAVTAEDVTGTWEIDSNSYREAAFNFALVQLERQGLDFDDREIERAIEPITDLVRSNPPRYTFQPDGTVLARVGADAEDYAGNWGIEDGHVVITSPDVEGKRRFRVESGYLIGLPDNSRGREIVLLRK